MEERDLASPLAIAPRALKVIGALAVAALGCGEGPPARASAPEPEAREGARLELRVSPTDTETLARLTVHLPTGTCGPQGSCARPLAALPRLFLDTTALSLGTEARVLPGRHILQVDEAFMEVALEPAELKTIVLAVARRRCVPAVPPAVPITHFGRTVTLGNEACGQSLTAAKEGFPENPLAYGRRLQLFVSASGNPCGTSYADATLADFRTANCAGWSDSVTTGFRFSTDPGGLCRPIAVKSRDLCPRLASGDLSAIVEEVRRVGIGDADRAFPPGEYSFVPPGTSSGPTKVNLTEGLVVEIPMPQPVVGAVPATFTTTIAFADPRELPPLAAASITSSDSSERAYTLPSKATDTLRLVAFQNPSASYTLNVGGRKVTLDQTRENAVSLRRLDVDDVRVTREDGTQYSVAAAYEIYFGGTRIAAGTTTSGLDMLPGEYELVLKYTTAEGARVQRQKINL